MTKANSNRGGGLAAALSSDQMINERGHRAKAAISHTDKGCLHSCLHTKKLNKTQQDRPCPWIETRIEAEWQGKWKHAKEINY